MSVCVAGIRLELEAGWLVFQLARFPQVRIGNWIFGMGK